MIERTGSQPLYTTTAQSSSNNSPETSEAGNASNIAPVQHETRINTRSTNDTQQHASYNFNNEVSFGQMLQGISLAAAALYAPSNSLSVLVEPQIKNPFNQPSRPQEQQPTTPVPRPPEEVNPYQRDDEDDVQYI